MSRPLWKHQAYAIDKYKDKPYFGLIFDVGLGKTLTSARIAEEKDKPVLIIAPSTLCNQWARELTSHDEEKRITQKEWEVVVCTSKTKHTKKFREAFKKLCED